MPTLEKRENETEQQLKARMDKRTVEMGITYSFAEYLEMMEKYLLQLERRVKQLEDKAGIQDHP